MKKLSYFILSIAIVSLSSFSLSLVIHAQELIAPIDTLPLPKDTRPYLIPSPYVDIDQKSLLSKIDVFNDVYYLETATTSFNDARIIVH